MNKSDQEREALQGRQESSISFFLVDVFAEKPLEGNPVAVVPDAGLLTDAVMHKIAREFNQSETTFIMPPTRAEAAWRLRSFTPAGKEAFGAGHNTLGAWWWLAETGALRLADSGACFRQQIGDSLLEVHVTCRSGELVSIGMSQSAPQFGRVCSDLTQLADALDLSTADFATETLPVQVVSTGAPHLLVPLRNRTAMEKARPDVPRLASVLHSLEGEGCYLFTLATARPDSIAHARFFNPTLGIAEDAATGTAAGPLACQLVSNGVAPEDSVVQIEQGYRMGRPSLIRVHVCGNAVQVSGRCCISGAGSLRVE